MTSTETAERFLRRFLDTYEAHDLDGLWNFYSHDCRFPVLERFGIDPTWDNYKIFMTTFIDAFPDIHHHIDKVVTDGESVWALYTMTGTHRGPIRGVQPTGKRVRYPIVAMYQVVGSVITEADFVSDDLRMMHQLGALQINAPTRSTYGSSELCHSKHSRELRKVIRQWRGTCRFGGRQMMKPVNSGKTVPGGLSGDDCGMPGLPRDWSVLEAARRPLRELMDDRLLDAPLERSRDQAGGLRLAGDPAQTRQAVADSEGAVVVSARRIR